MSKINFKDTFNEGMEYDNYLKTGSKVEQEKIEQNYKPLEFSSEVVKKIKNTNKKLNFLCVSEMWCPDCHVNLAVVNKICELSDNFKLSVLTLGRGLRRVKGVLELEAFPIPTIVILDENYDMTRLFLEKPEVVKGLPESDETSTDHRAGKYINETVEELLGEQRSPKIAFYK